MDDSRFDQLTRWAGSFSRRGVAAAAVGLFGGGLSTASAAKCGKGKKKCGKKCIPKKKCCKAKDCKPAGSGQLCVKHACVCPDGQSLCDGVCTPTAECCTDVTCDPVSNGTNVCVAGACQLTCNGGFDKCAGACVTAGTCCVGVTCPPVNHGTSTCAAGDCDVTCDADYANCTADPDGDCDTHLTNDAAHCGACNSPCTAQSPATCGRTGVCSNRQCETYSAGTLCSPAFCSGLNVASGAATCPGNGNPCPSQTPTNCGQFICAGGSCLTTCFSHSQCIPGSFCNMLGVCSLKAPDGGFCSQDIGCLSGVCDEVTGFCCSGTCTPGVVCSSFPTTKRWRCLGGPDCLCQS